MWLINNYKRLLSVSRWVLVWYQASYISHFNPESNNLRGFPGHSAVKNPPANAEDACLIPESRRLPGEGNGNLLQYSYQENPIVRGAWKAAVQEVSKSAAWLINWACIHSVSVRSQVHTEEPGGIAKESDTTKQQQTHSLNKSTQSREYT